MELRERRLALKKSGLWLAAALLLPYAAAGQSPEVSLNFDSNGLTRLPAGATIHTQFATPDQVPGVSGNAWRTDGFSSWASIPIDLSGSAGFTFSAWLALESYPSDLEVPVQRLSPSSIAHQREGSKGFDIYIDTYGRWGLWASTARQRLTLAAPGRFPLYEWCHVAAAVDTVSGQAYLYLNGKMVASAELRRNGGIDFADADLELARSHSEVEYLNFTLNRLNGAYDNVAVYDRALPASAIEALFAETGEPVPDAGPALAVPDTRFAGDFHRPQLHAMPPANWTNEPHGMVRAGNTWHLFYQRTPNGPFKTQMHWGHMASDDLVAWRHMKDALWPELQDDRFGFDQKGIWSGDVILDGGRAFAFYTSVNHFHRISASNPGIAMAVSEDPDLETWRKMGPILNSEHANDFRDPYLWREGDTWHMIIGATLDDGGGLVYYVLEPTEDGGRWVHRKRFSPVAYRTLDFGSAIWEMPVFEKLTEHVRVLVVSPIGGRVSKYGDPATRTVYWTGRWRDGLFHPHVNRPKMLDILPGHLAPTVARAADGSLRAIGIVDERRSPQSQEDAGWAHTFSFPRAWRLMPDGETLGQAPAPELLALRSEQLDARGPFRLGAEAVQLAAGAHACEVQLDIDAASESAVLTVDVLASPDLEEMTRLSFDLARHEVRLDKSLSTRSKEGEGPEVLRGTYDAEAFGEMRRIRVFLDGSVVEVFINDAAVFSFRSYPEREDSTGVRVSAPEGAVSLSGSTVWLLRSPG